MRHLLRTLPRYAALLSVVVIPTCHKKKAPAADPAAAAQAAAADAAAAIREQAWKDLQADVLTLRTQMAVVTAAQAATSSPPASAGGKVDAALYTCDRVALASRALADDAKAQPLLGEADAICGYQAPIAAGERRLAALESNPPESSRTAPAECGPIRDALSRVGQKYKTDARLAELVRRFKAGCPHVRLASARGERSSSGSSSSSSSSGRPDPSASRDQCKRRCDDAAFSCRASCQYCGSCTTDKTWEWCNATCNGCKSSCEQNEKFCQASCG